jgi:hypothetical protein
MGAWYKTGHKTSRPWPAGVAPGQHIFGADTVSTIVTAHTAQRLEPGATPGSSNMSVRIGHDQLNCFAQWGKNGRKFYFPCGDERARYRAKQRAREEGKKK